MKISNRRSNFEIIADMLRLGEAGKTEIMYSANMSYFQLQKYLNFLLQQNLIDKVTVGNPVVDGVKVIATVQRDGKGEKVLVFKYKPKVRYRRKKGHRQLFTRLSVDRIVMPGGTEEKPARKPRRRTKKEVTADGT